MTKDEILAMEAGVKLNELIHEEIMEQCWHEWIADIKDKRTIVGVVCKKCGVKQFKGYGVVGSPHYSTDISAAWHVVEKLIDIHPQGDFHLEHLEDEWCCGWCYPPSGADLNNWICGKTAPEAVCKAALVATLVR